MNWTVDGIQMYICSDILFSIIDFLPLHTIISGFAPVCHKFRSIAARFILPYRGVLPKKVVSVDNGGSGGRNEVEYDTSQLTPTEKARLIQFHVMLEDMSRVLGCTFHIVKKWNLNEKITYHELFLFLGSITVSRWEHNISPDIQYLNELFFERAFFACRPYDVSPTYLRTKSSNDEEGVVQQSLVKDKLRANYDRSNPERLTLQNRVRSFLFSITFARAMMELSNDNRSMKDKSMIIRIPLDSLSQLFLDTIDIYSLMTINRQYTIEEDSLSCESREAHRYDSWVYRNAQSDLGKYRYGGIALLANNVNFKCIRLTSKWPLNLLRELFSYLNERDRKLIQNTTNNGGAKPFSIIFCRDFAIDNIEELKQSDCNRKMVWPRHLFHFTIESEFNIENVCEFIRHCTFSSPIHLTIRNINIHGQILKIVQGSSISQYVRVLELDVNLFEFVGMSDINYFNQQLLASLPLLNSYTISQSKLCTTQDIIQNSEALSDFLSFFEILQLSHRSLKRVVLKDFPLPLQEVEKRLESICKPPTSLTLELHHFGVSVYLPRSLITEYNMEPHTKWFLDHLPTVSQYRPTIMSEYSRYSDVIGVVDLDRVKKQRPTGDKSSNKDPKHQTPVNSSCNAQ